MNNLELKGTGVQQAKHIHYLLGDTSRNALSNAPTFKVMLPVAGSISLRFQMSRIFPLLDVILSSFKEIDTVAFCSCNEFMTSTAIDPIC
eukprot:m.140161 g.140161  ORF g.140161 m.140161 type:complete len:90 (-) comp14820_c0_seq3:1452-1721(-)